MSCKEYWAAQIAGPLAGESRVAPGQVDGAQRCDHAGCDALVNRASNRCVKGHTQGAPPTELDGLLCLWDEIAARGGLPEEEDAGTLEMIHGLRDEAREQAEPDATYQQAQADAVCDLLDMVDRLRDTLEPESYAVVLGDPRVQAARLWGQRQTQIEQKERVRAGRERPSGSGIYLRQDDIDQHGAGCRCGLCNRNGKSYGVALVNVQTGEVDERVYGPSEDAAWYNARLQAQEEDQPVQNDNPAFALLVEGGWLDEENMTLDLPDNEEDREAFGEAIAAGIAEGLALPGDGTLRTIVTVETTPDGAQDLAWEFRASCPGKPEIALEGHLVPQGAMERWTVADALGFVSSTRRSLQEQARKKL